MQRTSVETLIFVILPVNVASAETRRSKLSVAIYVGGRGARGHRVSSRREGDERMRMPKLLGNEAESHGPG